MRRLASLPLMAVVLMATAPSVSACPPGLAKKNPPCLPPGQAMKGADSQEWLKRGDFIGNGPVRMDDWRRYDLPPIGGAEGYYRDGRIVYRVDEDTRRVLDWIILTDALLGN